MITSCRNSISWCLLYQLGTGFQGLGRRKRRRHRTGGVSTRRLASEQLGSGSVRLPSALPRHGLGDAEHGIDSLMVLDARRPKSRCVSSTAVPQQGALGGDPGLLPSQLLWSPDSCGFLALQLLTTDPFLASTRWHSLCGSPSFSFLFTVGLYPD